MSLYGPQGQVMLGTTSYKLAGQNIQITPPATDGQGQPLTGPQYVQVQVGSTYAWDLTGTTTPAISGCLARCAVIEYGPYITKASPLSVAPGKTVTLSGANFGTSTIGVMLNFQPLATTAYKVKGNNITVTMPPDAPSYSQLAVTADGNLVDTLFPFPGLGWIPVTVGPAITKQSSVGVTVKKGKVSPITLTGANFGTLASAITVQVSGTNLATTAYKVKGSNITITPPLTDQSDQPFTGRQYLSVLVNGVPIPSTAGLQGMLLEYGPYIVKDGGPVWGGPT